ncbi:hypothetical protein TWF694_004668 [Orbilia ellipsospora]|uniref:Uncharacterized protein n=1 Tax=Orbilia ellipsospora TaxID=2528407 RepID=A0AAV9WWY2_9PEZI
MQPTTIAICGFGSRGRLFHNIYIAEQLALLWQGKLVDQTFRRHVYYEMQSESEGPGTAFQLNSKAALNTGLPGPVPLNLDGLTHRQSNIIKGLTDVKSRYKSLVMAEPDLLDILMTENVSAAALLLHATNFETGDFNTDIPCGPRNLLGKALDSMTNEASELAEKYLPWLKIKIRYDTQIVDISFADPSKPTLFIKDLRTGQIEPPTHCDILLKATGTTWRVPVAGDIYKNAYTGVPDPESVSKYLKEHDMLTEDGFLIPGKSIFIGGTSLSAYDYIGLIFAKTRLVKLENSAGYKELVIDEAVAKDYQGLIKLFNRTPGDISPARHADGMSASFPDGFEFITPEMLLSVQVKKNCDPLPLILDLSRMVTAIATNKLPADIEPHRSTTELFDHLFDENERLAANPKTLTETAIFRKCLLSFLFTLSTSPNIHEHRSLLRRKYPLLVREPWDTFRSMNYTATHKDRTEEMFQDRNRLTKPIFNHMISSAPFPIHLLITRLQKLGVITWVQCDYNQVCWSLQKNHFKVRDAVAEVLIAPRALTETTDYLGLQVLPQMRQPKVTEPFYQKGRMPLAASGGVVHMLELGILGHGGNFDGRLTRGVQWQDTHSLEAGVQLMPIIVNIVSIVEGMVSFGLSQPFNELKKYYEEILPSQNEFNRQAKQMKAPSYQLYRFMAYSRLIEKIYPQKYSQIMRRGQDAKMRQQVISQIKMLGGRHQTVREAYSSFEKECADHSFDPISLEDFEKSTPDFSSTQIQSMKTAWQKTMKQLSSAPLGEKFARTALRNIFQNFSKFKSNIRNVNTVDYNSIEDFLQVRTIIPKHISTTVEEIDLDEEGHYPGK